MTQTTNPPGDSYGTVPELSRNCPQVRTRVRTWARSAAVAIVAVGVAWRIAAVFLNAAPHGDVHVDAVTLQSLWNGDGFRTPLERSVELAPPPEPPPLAGYPQDQHPPLALLLAAPLRPVAADPYRALQLI